MSTTLVEYDALIAPLQHALNVAAAERDAAYQAVRLAPDREGIERFNAADRAYQAAQDRIERLQDLIDEKHYQLTPMEKAAARHFGMSLSQYGQQKRTHANER